MARAGFYRMKEAAQRIASHAHAFLRMKNLGRADLLASVANLPTIRHSPLRRDIYRLYQRFKLLMSDGYNFELFYCTQLGTAHVADFDEAPAIEQLPSDTLLAQAHDLAEQSLGAASMRVLILRAVRKAEERGPTTNSYYPKVQTNTLHEQWRNTIEAAFRPEISHGPMARGNPLRSPKEGARHAGRSHRRAVSVAVVEDMTTFDRSIPEVVAYRASTRH